MQNGITLNGTTYGNDALRSVEIDADISLDGRTLDVDTMEATVEGTAALTTISRSAAAVFKRGGNDRSAWYVSKVEQVAPSLYRLSATSSLGRLAQKEHRGGIYTGQSASAVIDSICGTIPHRVSSAFAAKPVYGWLPFVSPSGEAQAPGSSAKDNLLQVLFSLGAALRTDPDGTLVIGSLPTQGSAVIGPDRIYSNGAYVEHDEPVMAVTVLEHQYTPGQGAETLFSGTATSGQLVVFEEPHGSLSASGFTILESGANYAVLGAGTGTLTGVPYVHVTREVTQVLDANASVANTVRVEDATLVSSVNGAEVAARLAAYHACKTRICVDAQIETEQAGDVVSIWDPFARIQRQATIEQIYQLRASNVMAGSLRALVGFTPPQPDDSELVTELLTGAGTWTVPAGVTEVSAVLIGGGQGGSRGEDGAGKTPSIIQSIVNGLYRRGVSVSSRAPGRGGSPGTAGAGGLIKTVELTVTPGAAITYGCGSGGAKSNTPGGTGSIGTATTFGAYSSAGGESMPAGVLEPGSGNIYGADGLPGVRGNDGTGYSGDTLIEPDAIVVNGVSYANGSRADGTITAQDGTRLAKVTAGYGGGAAYGANGGYAANGNAEITDYTTRPQPKVTVAASGAGANAAAPSGSVPYGQGGSAGHGGGGAGGYGTPSYGEQPNTYEGILVSWTAGAGGAGSDGTDGGDGCILLSYRIPASVRTLTGIAITTAPTKTAYSAGEVFDPTGMVVTASYSDGTSAAVSGYTFSPSGALTTSDTAVTISYTAGTVTKTATQAITVTPAAVTLVSIAVTTAPTQTAYPVGASFDPTGMVVTATYSDNSTAAVNGWTYSPSGALTANDTTITVSYTEGGITRTATQAIAVYALASIAITTPPTKTSYTAGESFDPTGMVVTATYNSGASAPVSGYTVSPSGALTTSDTSVTISYTEGGVTKTATQAITVSGASWAAYTAPQSGVTYTNGIGGLTESELSQAALAISDNAGITNATTEVWISVINRHIAVGDTISVTMDGNSYSFRVAGFNHYALTSATAYGAATATGKAGLALEMTGLLPTTYTISSSSATAASWDGSELCATLNGTIFNALPSALQGVAKQFDALYGNGSTVASRMTLASEYELTGANSYASGSNEGAQLAYWNGKTQADLILYDAGGTASGYWTRSRASGPSARYAYISATGAPSITTYSTGRRISPIFCI